MAVIGLVFAVTLLIAAVPYVLRAARPLLDCACCGSPPSGSFVLLASILVVPAVEAGLLPRMAGAAVTGRR